LFKKVIKMNKELDEAIRQQLEGFREKFGREAGPDDPLFFDPDYDVPVLLTEAKVKRELVKAARKAGLDVSRILSAFGFEDEEEGVAKDF
jgi:hypothetical protein